jgi:hypothetical protein
MSKQIQRRSKEEMFPIIEDWQCSGLTKKAYCEQKGVAQALFFYWQKKHKEEHGPNGFLPMDIYGVDKTFANGFIEVKHPNGVTIRLPENTGAEIIRRCVYL